MYYKVMKNNRVIDLLDNPIWVKYQKKHDLMLFCSEEEAQGVVSSDKQKVWHVDMFPRIESENRQIDTVHLEEIDEYEYEQLLALNKKTPEEIMDAYTLTLIKGGII